MKPTIKFYIKYYLIFGLFGLYFYHVSILTGQSHVNPNSEVVSQISAEDIELRRSYQVRSLRKVDTIVHDKNGSIYHVHGNKSDTQISKNIDRKKKPPPKNYRRKHKEYKNSNSREDKRQKVRPSIEKSKPATLTSINQVEKDRDTSINPKEKNLEQKIYDSSSWTSDVEGRMLPSCFSLFDPLKVTTNDFLHSLSQKENERILSINRVSTKLDENLIEDYEETKKGNIVEVIYSGEMGNNLFQAALGLILGGLLKYQVKMEPIKGFPTTYNRNLLETTGCKGWIEITEHNSRTSCESFNKIYEEIYSENKNENSDYCIRIVDGYFQRFALYQPFLKYLRDYMQPDKSELRSLTLPNAEDVIIHVRYWAPYPLERVPLSNPKRVRDDKFYPALDWEYYEKTISSFDEELCNGLYEGGKQNRNCGKLYVVCETEICASPLVTKLKDEKRAIIHSSSALEDFEFIRKATNVILPVSTFSWWATILSDNIENKVVHYPLAGIYHPENLMATNSDAKAPEDAELMKIKDPLDPKYKLWGSSIPGSITPITEKGENYDLHENINFHIRYIFHDLNYRLWFGSFQEETNKFVYRNSNKIAWENKKQYERKY